MKLFKGSGTFLQRALHLGGSIFRSAVMSLHVEWALSWALYPGVRGHSPAPRRLLTCSPGGLSGVSLLPRLCIQKGGACGGATWSCTPWSCLGRLPGVLGKGIIWLLALMIPNRHLASSTQSLYHCPWLAMKAPHSKFQMTCLPPARGASSLSSKRCQSLFHIELL